MMQYFMITNIRASRTEELSQYAGQVGFKMSHPFPDTLVLGFDNLPTQEFYTGEFTRVAPCPACEGTGTEGPHDCGCPEMRVCTHYYEHDCYDCGATGWAKVYQP